MPEKSSKQKFRLPLKKQRKYAIHSMFLTIQGEGVHVGRRAVFVRFSGCNVWSGRDEDRERDSSNSACAAICDTDFFGVDEQNGGGHFTADEIRARIHALWGPEKGIFVVFTGGEPSLQVDYGLLHVLGDGCFTAIETNGSRKLPNTINHVTLSPKPPMPVVEQRYDEVKVLYPLFDPADFEKYASIRWIQPVDCKNLTQNAEVLRACLRYIDKHPLWALSLQMHKVIGVP